MALPTQLPRTLAEASEDLARAYAQGLTKTALSAEATQALTGAAAGAGVGALGGVGAGLLGRKRKGSLLGTGLTGAMLGAGVGGGIAGLPWLQRQMAGPAPEVAQAASRAEAVQDYNRSPLGRGLHRLMNYDYTKLPADLGWGSSNPEVVDPTSPGARASDAELARSQNRSGLQKGLDILVDPINPGTTRNTLSTVTKPLGAAAAVIPLARPAARSLYDPHLTRLYDYAHHAKMDSSVRSRLLTALDAGHKQVGGVQAFAKGTHADAQIAREALEKVYGAGGKSKAIGKWGLAALLAAQAGSYLGDAAGNQISSAWGGGQ